MRVDQRQDTRLKFFAESISLNFLHLTGSYIVSLTLNKPIFELLAPNCANIIVVGASPV